MMTNILLHVCCGPCATHSIAELKRESFDVTIFFSNSNIHPEEEYLKRLNSLKRYAEKIKVPIIIDKYEPTIWFEQIKGFEDTPEGGKRCQICIAERLKKTAEYAKKNGFKAFTTTLTISPHKNTTIINELGEKLAVENQVSFVSKNFKKKGGFQNSLKISKEHELYRQNYCGCIYSIKK